MAAIELHRTRDRQHLPVPIRVERLEEDADTNDYRHEHIARKLDQLNARATGILVALVVASIMLALNLSIGIH